MKKISFAFFAILTAISFVACIDDLENRSNSPAQTGDVIEFGAEAVYESARKTRTVYGDEYNGMTEIKWYQGDKVRIYCAEAIDHDNNQYCDYDVLEYVGTTANPKGDEDNDGDVYEKNDVTRLQPSSHEKSGLQWGNGNHTFYAVYPSPAQLSSTDDAVAKNNFKMTLAGETAVIKGYLPNSQLPNRYLAATTDTNSKKHWTIHPAMRYAYMVARGTSTPSENYTGLTFVPIVAAVEMTIKNAITENGVPVACNGVSSIIISTVDGTPIAGDFTTTIDGKGFRTITAVANENDKIIIPVRDQDGYPIDLAPGDDITFTVFLLPTDESGDVNLNNLKVTIVTGFETKTATLAAADGSPLVVARKKNFVSNVNLNWNKETVTKNWLAMLSDNTKLGMLSIPGAGGATSGDANCTIADGYKQQIISIEELWDRGVRCFEFNTEVSSENDGLYDLTKIARANDLGGMNVLCNSQSTGVTLSKAISRITDLIKANPTEFAIVIIGYQSTSTDWIGKRSGAYWQASFYKFWGGSGEGMSSDGIFGWGAETKYNDGMGGINGSFTGSKTVGNVTYTFGTAEYDPDMLLGDARGKLFCFTRPTAIGGDGWWYSMRCNPPRVVPILGWGTMNDQWYARGYTSANAPYYVNGSGSIPESTTTTGGTNFIYTSYQNGGSDFSATDLSSVYTNTTYGSSDDKFMYRTCISKTGSESTPTNDNGTIYSIKNFIDYNTKRIYVQDWRRIANGKTTVTSGNYTYIWPSSIEEKKNDISTALTKSTSATDRSWTIYINSICGFFINNADERSYKPYQSVLKFNNGSVEKSDNKYNTSGFYNNLAGSYGDIQACADVLNPYFYDQVTRLGANTLAGPTGIVLMDRIQKSQGNSPALKAGYFLPEIIVANNFKWCDLKETTTDNASVMRVSLVGEDDGESYDPTTDILCAPEKR